ncbi:MAG: hypothetical protein HYT19_01055 [Candidatus Nealsonbacteria bacterium]|nr:hypothetical protein [Candidatus Nealsonbacteria bacterium]
MNVKIFRGKSGYHKDERRLIRDAVLESVRLPFPVVQVKTLNFFDAAVEQKMPVGNHYHPRESRRHEFFVFLGKLPEKDNPPAAIFRYREAGKNDFTEINLQLGDSCFVPAGVSHAFLPLVPGVEVVALSNKAFDDDDDIPDKLF